MPEVQHTRYQRLLVLLDESQSCERVIDEALALARRLDASLHGLVVESSVLGAQSQYQAEVLVHQFNLKGHRSPAREVLAELLGRGQAAHLEVSGSVTGSSAVVSSCVKAVATTRSDAIVIGQGFRASLLDCVLGPVALRIARGAGRPVLLVMEQDRHSSANNTPDDACGLGLL